MPSEKKKAAEATMDSTEDTRVISGLGEVVELQELKSEVLAKGERIRKKAKEWRKKFRQNGQKEKDK